MHTYALDFETYYDKECSITTLGLDQYVRHPDFDAYLVTVVGDDGTHYAGRPEEFNWSLLEGNAVVSHNAGFDAGVYQWLADTGKVPLVKYEVWDCTADMSAYFGVPRNLAGAAKALLDLDVSKEARDKMKGRKWSELNEADRTELVDYAVKDALLCIQIWTLHSHNWPEHERRISRLTRESGWRGVVVDADGLRADMEVLENEKTACLARLPWAATHAPLSLARLNVHLGLAGFPAFNSIDKKNPDVLKFVEDHPEITWIKDMWSLRSASVLQKKLSTMLSRIRDDGRMGVGLKYFGAHTGRDSGESGVNIQNMPRGEVLGVNLRRRITAAPGKVFVACDLGAIEPRALTYLSKDMDTLEAAKKVADWYEAQGRAWGLYKGELSLKEGDPVMRHMIKGMSIGLGYMMNASKYALVTGKSLPEAQKIVDLFRAKNPKIVKFWGVLDRGMKASAGSDFKVVMPSGRALLYRDVRNGSEGTSALLMRNGVLMRLRVWPGATVENLTQAFSRDIFMDRVLAIHDAGYDVALRVHDEVVVEVDEDKAEEAKEHICRIMKTSPAWCQDLPLAAEAKFGKTYADAK